MFSIRRHGLGVFLIAPLLLLAGCQAADQQQDFEYLPLFGDGSNDISPVVAIVDGIPITGWDMELRMDELPSAQRSKYAGPEGQRLLLRDMVDQMILAKEAVDEELYNLQEVQRTLITQRRTALSTAMRNIHILKDSDPTEEEIQDFYMDNRENYKKKGMVQARHIELGTKHQAEEAYARLMSGEWKDRFEVICKEYSINKVTKANDGDLGWFNRGGFLPDMNDYQLFSEKAYNLKDGVNPPFHVGSRWHIVDIRRREHDRSMTFGEARSQVLKDMMPNHQAKVVQEYLLESRKNHEVEFLGVFAPGQGLTLDALFAKARAVTDPNKKLELFKMIYTDFPESDRADDALFLSGNLALDTFQDRRMAGQFLMRVIREYPDSELIPDTQYLLDNMDDPNRMKPSSIEELRK